MAQPAPAPEPEPVYEDVSFPTQVHPISREALAFWQQRWTGDSFMAIGMQDPVLGPAAMRGLHAAIRDRVEPLLG